MTKAGGTVFPVFRLCDEVSESLRHLAHPTPLILIDDITERDTAYWPEAAHWPRRSEPSGFRSLLALRRCRTTIAERELFAAKGKVKTMAKATVWLRDQVCQHYPD